MFIDILHVFTLQITSAFMILPQTYNPKFFLDSETFFRDYWKRKPLYIPQALPQFKSPLSPEELAGLACEKMVESRIVVENGNAPWELRHGPFKTKDFQKLPTTHWTLLVQAVNLWVPQVSRILDYFNFLPHHFLDDIMMSYAPEQGSVGPHFDYYDVFILQGSGRRHWKLGEFCSPQTPIRKDTPLGILEQFHTAEDYVLEPGDILYIPQQQAHWGVTLEAGLSYSIGFRTPSYSELLNGFCNEWLATFDDSHRLQISPDANLNTPAKLDAKIIANVQQILQTLTQNTSLLRDWLGRWLTEPKYPELEQQTPHKRLSVDILVTKYKWLQRAESSRLAYDLGNDEIYWFVDGQSYQYPIEQQSIIASLCNYRRLACSELTALIKTDKDKELLQLLVTKGVIYFVD